MISREKNQVIALAGGLPPHTEALGREDLKGPRALFDESFFLPEPPPPKMKHRSPPARKGMGRSTHVPSFPDLPPPARKGMADARDLWHIPHEYRLPPACEGMEGDFRSQSQVLWEETGSMSPVAAARRILDEGGLFTGSSGGGDLAVPATVYLGGRCTSAFDPAWRLLEMNLLPEWGAFLSSCQTEGRGQLRRAWHSPRGNLHVCFRLPKDPNLQGDAASVVAGGLLALAFETLGFSLSLKWPNDLLLAESGKVGGLLLEERNGTLLAGLGVNLAECPPAALLRSDGAVQAAVLMPCRAAGSLPANARCPDARMRASEKRLAPFVLWRYLVSAAIVAYTHAVAGRSLPCVLHEFSRLLAWKGRKVTLTEADGVSFSGRHQGLGETGALRLSAADGSVREFFSGSLSLMGKA